jgi:hypothetical protein
MNLQPSTDPEQPGLWVNPAWQEGLPGTFAVVIGVSRYKHLEGGDEPAQDRGHRWIREARSLGQLSVSALTAFKFFEWLAEAYLYEAAPIAKCWFLVAPTDRERQQIPAITQHTAEPTLAACEKALGEWCAAMQSLPAVAQHQSRAVFFFSGHGLQVIADKQLLLPSDYLAGATPNYDCAISTHNLLYGLEALELPHRYYFVDACRNDFPEIRQMRPQGRAILPEDVAARSYAGTRAAAVLYATAASLQAWQPVDPADGPSIYGRALLEGLKGQPDIELRPKDGVVTVNFSKLESFVGDRVVQLLRERQATVEQPVQPGGTAVRDEVVAEISKLLIAGIRPQVSQPPTRGPDGAEVIIGARSSSERAEAVARVRAETLANAHVLEDDLRRGIWDASWDTQHTIFGSERVTDLWTKPGRMLIRGLESRAQLNRDQLLLHRIAWDRDHGLPRTYQAELEIDDRDSRGYWLQLVDTGSIAHGCILPADRSGRPRYMLEFQVELDPGVTELTLRRLEASFSFDSPGPLAAAARLWRRYRDADVSQAVTDFELGELEKMVREKLESPLASTVAALVLLRANRLDLLRGWLRNLANWFEELPDGAVLWAEQVMRQAEDRARAVSTAVEYLGLLDERGLPFTSEAFSYATSLVSRLSPAIPNLPEGPRSQFERVKARLDAAVAFFRPGGLFTTYSHFGPQTRAPGAQLPAGQPGANGSPPPSGPALRINVGEDWVDIGGVVLSRRGAGG